MNEIKNESNNNQYTVRIALAENSPIKGENLWAEKVGPDLYQLRNTPFFANGLAWGDVVRCTEDEQGILHFEKLVDSGQNGTLRVYFEPKWDFAIDRILAYLTYVGCTFESSGRLYAFDVPTEPDLKISHRELASYLNELQESGIIAWEKGKWPKESNE
jgi:hypothetical protein